jgi:hypothetical protein
MNPHHLQAGLTPQGLDEAERTVMGKKPGGAARKIDIDPVRLYTEELNQLAEELGIDLLDDADPAERAATPLAPAIGGSRGAARGAARAPTGRGAAEHPAEAKALRPRPSDSVPLSRGAPAPRGALGNGGARPGPVKSRIDDLIDDLDLGDDGGEDDEDEDEDDEDDDDGEDDDEDGSECDCDDDCPEECSCECHEECDCDDDCPEECSCDCHDESGESGESGDEDDDPDGDDEKVDRIISRLESDLGIHTDGRRERRRLRVRPTEVPHVERRRGGDRDRLTDEQERRRHINSVVADIRGETRTTFGVERERVQDIKASKLEQIGQLRMTLEDEGIDCSSVSNPNSDSPMAEIDSVLNILRLKNDRNRYSSLADEVILGVAEGIETVFDGTRAVPLLGWRPDYTGYHNTVNVKLHRMRFETSQIVGNIIERYNIGPTARIVMELLPSFFLYPRQQKKERGSPGLSSEPHVGDPRGAFASIRESDQHKDLNDVRRL